MERCSSMARPVQYHSWSVVASCKDDVSLTTSFAGFGSANLVALVACWGVQWQCWGCAELRTYRQISQHVYWYHIERKE